MAVCSNCTKTKAIPQCTEEIIIGAVADAQEGVLILAREILTGREYTYEGVIGFENSISFEPDDFFSEGFLYDLSVINGIADFQNPLTIIINAEEYTCLEVQFVAIKNSEGVVEGAESITIEIYDQS